MMLLRGIEPKYFKLVMDTRIEVSPPKNSQWVVLPVFSRGKTNHWINPQLFQGCTQLHFSLCLLTNSNSANFTAQECNKITAMKT